VEILKGWKEFIKENHDGILSGNMGLKEFPSQMFAFLLGVKHSEDIFVRGLPKIWKRSA